MCAVSVRIHKEQMVNVDPSHLDPQACLKNFKARLLTGVDPFAPVVLLQAREGSEVTDLEPVNPKAPEASSAGSGWSISGYARSRPELANLNLLLGIAGDVEAGQASSPFGFGIWPSMVMKVYPTGYRTSALYGAEKRRTNFLVTHQS